MSKKKETSEILELKKQISELKEAVKIISESENEWVNRYDKLIREHEQLGSFVKENIQKLKQAFRMGISITGEITIQDIEYNLDLLPRMIDYKFFPEEKQ